MGSPEANEKFNEDMFLTLEWAPNRSFHIIPSSFNTYTLEIHHFNVNDYLCHSQRIIFLSEKEAEDALLLVKLAT
jgi:hypothetical protein